MLGAVPIVIPSTNYYNPFGAVGSPNRLPGYTGPALDLYLGSAPGAGTAAYRPIDAGPRKTEVENLSTRALVGLRGDFAGWNWESGAALYRSLDQGPREPRLQHAVSAALATLDTGRLQPVQRRLCRSISRPAIARASPRAVIDAFPCPSIAQQQHITGLLGLQVVAA